MKKRFFFPTNLNSINCDVYLHVCSAGEAISLAPIIEELIKKNYKILISVITQTGFDIANKLYNHNNIQIVFLPFETFLPFNFPRTKNVIVFEAELWLSLFFIAKKRNAKTMLINARISDRSINKYMKIKFFYAHLFKYIDSVLAQRDIDRGRLEILGAKNISVNGNIKILNDVKITKKYAKFDKKVIMLASSHFKNISEEELFLNAFIKSKLDIDDFYLIIAPRHPNRFDNVFNICKKYFKTQKLSQTTLSNDSVNSMQCNILLIDTFGELINFYAIADIVVLGGSFVKVGGHNPLECAHFNVKLISGKEIFNQLALFDLVENAVLIENDKLATTLKHYQNLEKSSIKLSKKYELMQKILGEIQ